MGPVETAIREARALITDPSHWTQHTLARNQYGEVVWDPFDARATAWCHNGALEITAKLRPIHAENRLEAGDFGEENFGRLLQAYRLVFARSGRRRRHNHAVLINNFHHRGMAHRATLRMMDRAAAIAGERGW